MSTYMPSYAFSLDASGTYVKELYGSAFYSILEAALERPRDFNTRSYSFRGEVHIGALLRFCEVERLVGLGFVGYELTVIQAYQLKPTLKSLENITSLIKTSLEQSQLEPLAPLIEVCYHVGEEVVLDDVRAAYQHKGNLMDVSPYHTGGDEGVNVLQSVFDYIKSLHELVAYCIETQRLFIYFHHPA